ncbi:MAG: DNA/RNA non-specific endonuclease [Rikenellaceae bacterium]|nr:DNA/RNA non-specific endonuclease [Rikenellaceae bacterium]
MRNFKKILGVVIAVAAAVIGTCCGEKNPVTPDSNCKAKFSVGENVEWNTASQFVVITAPATQKWTARVKDDWAWFDYEDYHYYTQGQGNGSVALYIASNGASKSRSTTVEVEFEGTTTVTLKLTQGAFVQAEAPEIDYEQTSWAEMPLIKQNDGNIYVTHMTKDDKGKPLRNYSMCYDPDVKAALWVAYPLHKCYTRKVIPGRTEAWGYDPHRLIDSEYQVNMAKGMGNGYDRGHQIPSADRMASYDMNSQTFYYTNMTAQVAAMNQGIWNNLENMIRNEWVCSDTLYVVTGCVMTTASDPNVQWVDNRNGGKVAVPKAYFKVLLRTKSGNTGKAVDNSNATTIGFWYENRSYGNINPRESDVKSVDEIERLTGFTFFPQISDEIKEIKDGERWFQNM